LITLSVLGQALLLCYDQSHYLYRPATRKGNWIFIHLFFLFIFFFWLATQTKIELHKWQKLIYKITMKIQNYNLYIKGIENKMVREPNKNYGACYLGFPLKKHQMTNFLKYVFKYLLSILTRTIFISHIHQIIGLYRENSLLTSSKWLHCSVERCLQCNCKGWIPWIPLEPE